MNRFFVSSIEENIAQITGDDFLHGKNSLRLKAGEKLFIVCNETEYLAQVSEIEETGIKCLILEKIEKDREADINITLFQCLPKLDKMDYIVQKNTEIGVRRIVPVISKRTIVKIKDDKKEDKKVQRWEKIAAEAAKQSMRNVIPEITHVLSFGEMIKRLSGSSDIIIVPYECEQQKTLKEINFDKKNISVVIGPEGGFDDSEISLLKKAGGSIVTLGPRILRTETAALAANAVIMYKTDNI